MKTRNVTFTLDEDTLDLLRATAGDRGLPVATLVRQWVEGGIKIHCRRVLELPPELKCIRGGAERSVHNCGRDLPPSAGANGGRR